ncbi:2,3-diaminopropionate biosynthesis protein SbnB [Fulvivirga kasyanovii]|uniref:2,3-diaminopropionate biosynthesis protein SbnB n=1 Tax=Fulvivirga kasyanovii TaxID=396812 RepID=UPI0031D83E9B
MLYLNKKDIEKIGNDWNAIADIIKRSVVTLGMKDFSQPVKPYLRYNDLTNRIIAMPAYIGGDIALSGIKWIASFPGNLDKGIPRAHSVTILNEASTGVPLCTLNTPLISGIRTAGVTALVIKEWLKHQDTTRPLNVGITGFGPIGQLHLEMVWSILGDRAGKVFLYDLRGIEERMIPTEMRDKVVVCESWEHAYVDSDIFMTCTVSKAPYIDKKPKKGSLQLNVSLRDYKPEIMPYIKLMIVDDWEEVCREETDIEVMHKKMGLKKEDTVSIVEMIDRDVFKDLSADEVAMFNPMGMAVFDIAIGRYYYQKALDTDSGVMLED